MKTDFIDLIKGTVNAMHSGRSEGFMGTSIALY